MNAMDDAAQVRYKYLAAMSRLRSFLRLSVVANLLIATLLFPALHFHPVDDHAHDSDGAHRHGIVHADFLNVLAENRNEHDGVSPEDVHSDWPTDGIGLRALTSHRVEFLNHQLQKQIFIQNCEQPVHATILFRPLIIEHASPPHMPDFGYLPSPRSPPRHI